MTDLTDRMRTCAAHIVATYNNPYDGKHLALADAVDLLIEASNIIEAAAPRPEPMEIIPPVAQHIAGCKALFTKDAKDCDCTSIHATDADLWIAPGGPLPGLKQSGTVSPRVCPKCDSRAGKRVYRQDNHLMLACPVCGHAWEFKKTAGMTGG